jgi:hypothetical protein
MVKKSTNSHKCIKAFNFRKSVHRHTIQINQPTRCNSFTSLLLDVHVWLNMFLVPLRPSSGAYKCTGSLWYYRSSVAVGASLVVVWQLNLPEYEPTTLQPPLSEGKTRGSQCSCMLLMMGGEAPETWWATHKRQVINLWNCCIWLVDLFESYKSYKYNIYIIFLLHVSAIVWTSSVRM